MGTVKSVIAGVSVIYIQQSSESTILTRLRRPSIIRGLEQIVFFQIYQLADSSPQSGPQVGAPVKVCGARTQ